MRSFLALVLSLASLSAFAQTAQVCAVAFNGYTPSASSSLRIMDGDAFHDLNLVQMNRDHGDWDNRITRVAVAQGCTFLGYQYQEFGTHIETGAEIGWRVALTNQTERRFLGHALDATYNNAISSLKCHCR